MSESRGEDIVASNKEVALTLLQEYSGTRDEHTLDKFNETMHSLYQDGAFEAALWVYQEAIERFPDDPLLYHNAARLCKAWSDKLAGDYFDSKGVLGMDLMEWMFGKGTPYQEFLELRRKAAGYLDKVLELSTDLPDETRDAVQEEIFMLRWS